MRLVPTRAPRSRAGFLSTAATFSLPVGRSFADGDPRGYYLDLTVKADEHGYPAKWLEDPDRILHVWIVQRGLGCHERFVRGDGEAWLADAVDVGRRLLATQQSGGPLDGGWRHARPFPHTFPLPPGWLSGITQGQAASLFVRLFEQTGDERFATGALRALKPLQVDVRSGGLLTRLRGHRWYEEYPTRPGSFVLNGGIFALLGLRDAATALDDDGSRAAWEEGLGMLDHCLHLWDTGHWSRYDLHPHPVVNVASSFYHSLHVNLLRVVTRLEPRAAVDDMLARFERYAARPTDRGLAFARKSLFRLAVPRNALSLRAGRGQAVASEPPA